MTPLRIGVLGCGPFAQAAHFEGCAKAKGVELFAICDVAPDLLARMGATYEPARTLASRERMLGDAEVDAVVAGLRDAILKTGVAPHATSATYNMSHPDGTIRAAGHHSLSTLARVAEQDGVPVLTVCAGSRNAADQWAQQTETNTASLRAPRRRCHRADRDTWPRRS